MRLNAEIKSIHLVCALIYFVPRRTYFQSVQKKGLYPAQKDKTLPFKNLLFSSNILSFFILQFAVFERKSTLGLGFLITYGP